MATVVYKMNLSADGYIADPDGSIYWTAPDDELFAFQIEQLRGFDAYLLGRHLYEDMRVWETDAKMRDSEFGGLWAAIPKVVFSSTLDRVEGNTTLATGDVAEELARLGDATAAVGGAGLAASFVERDLVDEYRLFVDPIVLGGGTRFFPERDGQLELELVEQRMFGETAYLRYRRLNAR